MLGTETLCVESGVIEECQGLDLALKLRWFGSSFKVSEVMVNGPITSTAYCDSLSILKMT